MIFGWNWPVFWKQITKRQLNIKLCFVLSRKLPIKTRQSGQFHFLKMLKANLLQDRLAQKIEKVDTLFSVWETPRCSKFNFRFSFFLQSAAWHIRQRAFDVALPRFMGTSKKIKSFTKLTTSNIGWVNGEVEIERVEFGRVEFGRVEKERVEKQRLHF